MTQRTKKIPEKKIQRVDELADTIKNKKTILLASIKNIPASQYQLIVKKLRGKAIVKFPKKSILFRAFDKSGDEAVKKLKEHVKSSTAILFSDMDSFELAAELLESKTPARAKPGQLAPKDIIVNEGPTDLVPGPAISELGAVGIPIQIEKGKIHIKKTTTIVKEGEKISDEAADVMNKLDMKPFSVGFIPLAVFDKEHGKLYLDINIDKEKAVDDLKYAFGKALAFTVEIGHANKDTVKFLIGKAGSHEKVLSDLAEKSPEENQEEKDESGDEEDRSSEKTKEPEKKEDEKTEVKESDDKGNTSDGTETGESADKSKAESGDENQENENQDKSKEEK